MTDDLDVRSFARTFTRFLDWLHESDAGSDGNPLTQRLRAHLGPGDEVGTSVVARELPPFEQVNLQVALDAWSVDRDVEVLGYTLPPHHMALELGQLLHGHGIPPLRVGAPDQVDLPSGPDRTTAVWRTALLLVSDARGRYAVMVRGPERHQEPTLTVEVAGLATEAAQEVLAELDGLRDRHNVYRGQVLEFVQVQGGLRITFPQLPLTSRADVVLPDAVLARVERHTIGIAGRRAELRAAGQHLKRGLLLYGPPGTGKTHTTRYVVQHLPGATVVLLSGRALHLIGPVSALARDLQPSVVVLEDVDLVAEDRVHHHGGNPVLFELLDAMDGAAGDADLLFLLTTNRADLLERALATRPGRVDVAIEIGLPDDDARRRLLEVYSRGTGLVASPADVEHVVAATAGVTASFIKEMVRRAVLESLVEESGQVTGVHLRRAAADLLDSTQGLTRALLGVPAPSVD